MDSLIRNKFLALINKIKKNNELYFQFDQPTIPDSEYDKLIQEKNKLLTDYPELRNISTESVGYNPAKKFAKYTYTVPMLSLDKSYTTKDVEKFIRRVEAFFPNKLLTFLAEPKIDGLSLNIRYERGTLVLASTRGNGYTGENITTNILHVPSIPHTLPEPVTIEIRGELYMPIASFVQINKAREKDNLSIFQNPRNAVAGKVRNINPDIAVLPHIHFFGYYYGQTEREFNTLTNFRKTLQQWGFDVIIPSTLCHNLKECMTFFSELEATRSQLPYDADGVVYKLNNIADQREMGNTTTAPRWAIALKFSSNTAFTHLTNIFFQVGRTGMLTPVAIVKPVNVGGVFITRASVHNYNIFTKMKLHFGDKIEIKRAGDVIPQIIQNCHVTEVTPISFPENCPSCNQKLHKKFPNIICTNHNYCPAQVIEYLAYITSRTVLNIDGMGKKTIALLYENNLLMEPADIFNLHAKERKIIALPGMNILSYRKLISAIDQKKNIPLTTFIIAMGIPGVGVEFSEQLAILFHTFKSWWYALTNLDDSTVAEQFKTLEGLQDKRLAPIKKIMKRQVYVARMYHFSQAITIQNTTVSFDLPLHGLSFAFTGGLTVPRNTMKIKIKRLGGTVTSSLSKKTTYLITGKKPTKSKIEKAKELSVSIIDEPTLQALLAQKTK